MHVDQEVKSHLEMHVNFCFCSSSVPFQCSMNQQLPDIQYTVLISLFSNPKLIDHTEKGTRKSK